MSISVDPETGLKVFATRAASRMDGVKGRGYAVVDDGLTELAPRRPAPRSTPRSRPSTWRSKRPAAVRRTT